MKRVVDVQLGARSYPVSIAPGLLDDANTIAATVGGRHALIVSNEVVAPLALAYERRLLDALTAAERTQLDRILERLAEVQRDLVAKEVEIHPGRGAAAFPAAKHIAIEGARRAQIGYVESKVEGRERTR